MREAMKSLEQLTLFFAVVGLVGLGIVPRLARAASPIVVTQSQLNEGPIVVHGSQLESKPEGQNSRFVFSFNLPSNMSADDVQVVYLKIGGLCNGGQRGIIRGQAFCVPNNQPKKTSNVIGDIMEMSLSDTLVSRGDPCGDGSLYLGVSDEVRCAYKEGLGTLLIAVEGVGDMEPKTETVDLYFHNHAYPAGSRIIISPYNH